MLARDEAMKAIGNLPPNATYDDVFDAIERLADTEYDKDIELALTDIEQGREGKSLEEVRAKFL